MPTGVSKQLTVASVIDYYDGPLIFTATDPVGTTLLCTFLQNTSVGSEYLCLPLSESRLNAFLVGIYDLRKIYDTPEMPEYYKLTTTANNADALVARPIDFSEVPPDLLPALGYFVEPEIVQPRVVEQKISEPQVVQPQQDAVKEVESRRSLLEASLEVVEAKSQPVIDTYTLASLLRHVQDAIKYSYKKEVSGYPQAKRQMRSNPVFFATQFYDYAHTSFTAKLRSVDSVGDPDLSGNEDFDYAVQRVFRVVELAAANPEEALLFLRENKGHFVSAIKRLVGLSIERQCGLGIGWKSNHSTSRFKRARMSFDDAVRLQAALDLESELEDEFSDYVGIFTIINTETKPQSWGFRTEDGSLMRGDVDPTKGITIAGVPTLTVKYRIWCEEKMIEEASGRQCKATTLYNLRPADAPIDVLESNE